MLYIAGAARRQVLGMPHGRPIRTSGPVVGLIVQCATKKIASDKEKRKTTMLGEKPREFVWELRKEKEAFWEWAGCQQLRCVSGPSAVCSPLPIHCSIAHAMPMAMPHACPAFEGCSALRCGSLAHAGQAAIQSSSWAGVIGGFEECHGPQTPGLKCGPGTRSKKVQYAYEQWASGHPSAGWFPIETS